MRWHAGIPLALMVCCNLLVCPAAMAQGKLTSVSLTTSVASPQPIGTAITLTATAAGGVNVQYSFRARYIDASGVTRLSTLRGFNTLPTFRWVPKLATDYQLYAIARDTGSTTVTQVTTTMPYTITADTPPPTVTRIAFISTRDGNEEIYTMKPDGTDEQRLTTTPALEMEMAWSPDGKTLVFVSKRTGSYELFTMNADGSNQKRLTVNGNADWGPTYAPDGRTIWFFRSINGTDEIFSMNADGTNEQRWTTNTWFDVLPIMTPDRSKIIFCSDRNGTVRQANYDIYSMNPDGTNPVRLTDYARRDWYQAVSPDGKYIAYTCDNHINIMNIDGSEKRQLTFPTTYQDKRPTFSPDGNKIAFTSNRDGNWEIYVMNADGSAQTRVTSNSWDDYYPCWSPK